MKIGPTVRPGRRIEKKRTGRDRTVKKVTKAFNQSINQSVEIFSVAQIESITETTKWALYFTYLERSPH